MPTSKVLSFLWILSLTLTAACADEQDPATSTQEEALPDDPTLVGVLPDVHGKGDTQQLAPGVYVSGVPTQRFNATAMPDEWGRQRQSQWCWAATSQMILNFHGIPVPQEDVVLRAYGDFRDRPANMYEIASSLNGWTLLDRAGRPRTIAATPFEQMYVTDLLTDLHFNQPVVLGLKNEEDAGGHAYVLSAISYQVDGAGFVYPFSVDLRDPWPDHPGHITISWENLLQRFIGYVRIRTY